MLPETWLPTWTFWTGFKVPVAVTACVICPRVTVAVWNVTLEPLVQRRSNSATAIRTTAAIMSGMGRLNIDSAGRRMIRPEVITTASLL
jgi:hypothetical protein